MRGARRPRSRRRRRPAAERSAGWRRRRPGGVPPTNPPAPPGTSPVPGMVTPVATSPAPGLPPPRRAPRRRAPALPGDAAPNTHAADDRGPAAARLRHPTRRHLAPRRAGQTPAASPSTPAQIIVSPPGTTFQVAGGPYTVPVSINNASRISVITLTVTYNPAVLRVRTVQDGTFMRQGGVTASFTPRIDAARAASTSRSRAPAIRPAPPARACWRR